MTEPTDWPGVVAGRLPETLARWWVRSRRPNLADYATELDDVVSEVQLMLHPIVAAFDPTRGVSLRHYAARAVYGRLDHWWARVRSPVSLSDLAVRRGLVPGRGDLTED